MNTKQSLKLKKKSLKNKKTRDKKEYQCIWIFISSLPEKEDHNRASITDDENTSPKTGNNAETFSAKSTTKRLQESRIIRLPKNECSIPFLVTLFNDLCNSGAVCMDEGEMTPAVNIIAKAKKDWDEGIQWKGNIEISENITLKLYKSGLVLHYKK